MKLKGIVLHRLKYSETSLIIKIFTCERGLISCFVRGARSKKKTPAFYQPGNIVAVELTKKNNSTLYSVKECSIEKSYKTIFFDVNKTMIVTFLCEVVYKTQYEEQPDEDWFNFMEQQFTFLDEKNNINLPDFYLSFLFQLTKYLGFPPENNYKEGYYFNYTTGGFSPVQQKIGAEESKLFSQALTGVFPETKSPQRELVNNLFDYFKEHIENFAEIKSLSVFQEF